LCFEEVGVAMTKKECKEELEEEHKNSSASSRGREVESEVPPSLFIAGA